MPEKLIDRVRRAAGEFVELAVDSTGEGESHQDNKEVLTGERCIKSVKG